MRRGSTTTMTRARRLPATTASVFTALALVGGAMVAVAPTAGAQTRTPTKTASDLPLLRSDPAPKVEPGRLVGDFTNPPPNPDQVEAGPKARPSAYDPARSVVVDTETTPTKQVLTNPDGSRTEISSATPVRFSDAAGWHAIDLDLVPGPDGTLAARSAQGSARLAPRADGVVATIDTPAGPIGLRHPQAAPATAVVDKARATYKGALGDRDLLIDLRVNGFEETVVLASAKAANTYTDEFVLPAGVSARDGEAGVEFIDAKGSVLATFSNGIAFDSAPQRAAAPVSVRVVPNAVPTTTATTPSTTPPAPTTTSTTAAPGRTSTTSSITAPAAAPSISVPTTSVPTTTTPTTTPTTAPPATATENVATVEVSVSPSWLSDPARIFPVALDPILYTEVATNAADAYGIDTFGWAAAATTNYGAASALYVGNISGVSQSFIKFNNLVVTPAADSVVIESHLMLLGGAANDCSKPVVVHGIENTLSASTVWNNKPATAGAAVSTTTLAANCGSAWNSFDTTSLARSWITAGAPNNGLRVSAADEVAAAAFKWFWSGNTANPPLLYITYDRPPGLSGPVAPADTAVVGSATPTLATSPTTDPDGDTVKYWFRATPAADAESGARAVDSGWLTATPTGTPDCVTGQICYAVPAGALTDGVTYYWHVWTVRHEAP